MLGDNDILYGDVLGSDATDGEVRVTLGWADEGKGHCTEVPVFATWGFCSRPMPPTMAGGSAVAAAQAYYFRDGDQHVCFGMRDNRYISKLGALDEGDLVMCHHHGGFFRLVSNDDDNGTDLTAYVVRNDENGVPQKASVISMSSKEDSAHIAIVHEKGHSIQMNVDGDITIANHAGDAFINVKPDGSIIISGSSVCIAGGVSIGSDNPATQDFIALASLVTTALDTLKDAISTAAVTAGDGGAAFKANILASLVAWPTPLASSKAKAAF